jgi:hypothetical protein
VTYGFDPSFIKFFGTNGVAAVESAIQVINDLPPASEIALTNYPFDTIEDYSASALSLLDLKSWTLSLLLEQMGLAQPTRYIFALRQWNPIFLTDSNSYQWPDSIFPDDISERNYDPQTLTESQVVNGNPYFGNITTVAGNNYVQTGPVNVDLPWDYASAVADQELPPSDFYTGLTYDDVGGLCYLFSTNNVIYESLSSGVSGLGNNSYINGAWRPGINKMSFVPQAMDPNGAFLPTTNYFIDTYLSNGVPMQQSLMRVSAKPDFLFCAGDVQSSVAGVAHFTRTSTSNWMNNAAANGNANGAGPGTIQPPIQIIFNKLGPNYQTDGAYSEQQAVPTFFTSWGSFDATTNPPVFYPVPQTGSNQMTIHLWLQHPASVQFSSLDWKLATLTGAQFAVETSSNLVNWTTLFTVTNDSSSVTLFNYDTQKTWSQFYRLAPQ